MNFTGHDLHENKNSMFILIFPNIQFLLEFLNQI